MAAIQKTFPMMALIGMFLVVVIPILTPKNIPNITTYSSTKAVREYEFTMASMIEENMWFSMKHQGTTTGSVAVMTTAMELLSKSPDQLQLWASAQVGQPVMMAGVYITKGQSVGYVAWKTKSNAINFADTVGRSGFEGYKRLGQSPYAFKPADLVPAAAWVMTKGIGHEERSDFLSIGAGMERWQQIKVMYGLNILVGAFPVPTFKK